MSKKVLFTTVALAVLTTVLATLGTGQPQALAAQPAPAEAPDLPALNPPLPPAPAPLRTEPSAPPDGAALKTELESLDATIQAGLEELAKSTADFATERKKWQSLDRSMASARAVNAALFARNKVVVSVYDSKLEGPLAQFKARLTSAPAVYRKLADERRQLLASATLEVERKNYLAMVQTCEAAAALCEKRREEIFGETAAEAGFGNKAPRPNAVSLRRTIENMKKLHPMHEKWEETFKAYPSALETPGLTNWFEALSLYSEDLDTFTKGVEELKDAMKRKAADRPEPAPKAMEERVPPKAPPAPPVQQGGVSGTVPVVGPGNRVVYYVRR
jgi:hypothetical protein